ncbi:MAG TPA: hypothetical protein VFO70_04640, partial [Chitinophagaceae bacterium]|nr:hypothetical protein [Chitinophagaceae bacterium]
SADRLGKITPGLSHTVHMPSHIYLRAGHYNKGVTVNENAVNSYKKLVPLYGAVTGNDFLYIIHNLHMQTNNAMLAGRAAYTIESAFETMNSVPKDYLAIPGAMGSYMQNIHMTPVIGMVRFGKWEELLSYPQPDAAHIYANVIYRFGRGMALTAKSDLKGAEQELVQIQQLMKDSVLYAPFPPFSPAIEGARVAADLLKGMIALKQKNNPVAIAAFRQAVHTEENMVYNEPRDWMLNTRHYLGKALLVAGKWKEAETVFKKDLENNNENVWALKGLQQALLGMMNKDAGLVLTRLNKAASKADIKISGPVY